MSTGWSFFGYAFRFDGRFADKVWLEKVQRGVDQGLARGDATKPGETAVGMHFHKGVQVFPTEGFRRSSPIWALRPARAIV